MSSTLLKAFLLEPSLPASGDLWPSGSAVPQHAFEAGHVMVRGCLAQPDTLCAPLQRLDLGKGNADHRVDDFAGLDDLLHTAPHRIHGNGKADPRVGTRRAVNCCVHS